MIEMHHQDFRDVDVPNEPYVIITDPRWPVESAPVTGCNNAAALLQECAEKYSSAERVAIILGCNVDPAIIPRFGSLNFFRACWLPYAVPGRWGRLLHSGDVAYLYGVIHQNQKKGVTSFQGKPQKHSLIKMDTLARGLWSI